MRWHAGKFQDKREWHLFFAWHPVLVDGKWVWLERVERKVRDGCDGIAEHVWQYRFTVGK